MFLPNLRPPLFLLFYGKRRWFVSPLWTLAGIHRRITGGAVPNARRPNSTFPADEFQRQLNCPRSSSGRRTKRVCSRRRRRRSCCGIHQPPPKTRSPFGGRGEVAGILRDSGREQREIGEAAAVESKVVDGALVEQRANGAGLGFDQGGQRVAVAVLTTTIEACAMRLPVESGTVPRGWIRWRGPAPAGGWKRES
jgi:hypothetical protein